MKIKLFKETTKMPKKSHLPDCGLDIFQPEAFDINPLETKTIGLELAVAIPEGFAGMLVPRSSIAEKGLIIQTSIIDPDYIGEIHLIITNCSNNVVNVEKNQRLCSLVCVSVLNAYLERVDELYSTTRFENGLGSSGKWIEELKD